jgi:hypothetical protein
VTWLGRSAGDLAEPRAGAFQLEPHVRGSLVDAPAAGQVVDDVQAPAAELLEVVAAQVVLEAGALVDDLDDEAVVVDAGAEPDVAYAVAKRVRDELADEQLGVDEQVRLDMVGAEVPERAAGVAWRDALATGPLPAAAGAQTERP